MKHLRFICTIGYLVMILMAVISMSNWAFQSHLECPPYRLPDYLEGLDDGSCAAIGLLLQKATANKCGCVMVTNNWWHGDNPVFAELADEMAKGY
jgi:hypothetical protein